CWSDSDGGLWAIREVVAPLNKEYNNFTKGSFITMIRHTFNHLDGIGEKSERRLWRRGILTWDDFFNCGDVEGINTDRKNQYEGQLRQCACELHAGNSAYFAGLMKRREHWRLYDMFRGDACCLDIETNGLPAGYGGYVTVVGLYDGLDWRCLLRGENLTAERLNSELSGYKYLITFYGVAFDIPFLFRCFPGVRFDIPHFDLCFAARRLGIQGGLKKLESLFGIEREDAVRGMNGYDAVKLWAHAERGSAEALRLLLTYNREDTANLLGLADVLYGKLRESTGIGEYVGRGCA
ncbi:MAG TPA: ribonuclease H-like domain-containing protein, partial [Dissulfurispiraceae bacterium]|nr:ribonuclease H-like domain-containing protein [Dissulfurispiraceae bacterium]